MSAFMRELSQLILAIASLYYMLESEFQIFLASSRCAVRRHFLHGLIRAHRVVYAEQT